jgi:hypothetical protein
MLKPPHSIRPRVGQAAKSVSEKWVARATRPPRSATRRPERGGAKL